jgi:hypothetical protein
LADNRDFWNHTLDGLAVLAATGLFRVFREGSSSPEPARGQACARPAGRRFLIDADREIPGRIDAATGDIELDDLADTTVDDVLDDLAVLALKLGAQVWIVPTERMPTDTGIAAT